MQASGLLILPFLFPFPIAPFYFFAWSIDLIFLTTDQVAPGAVGKG
jgi:hypothetical protein